MGNNVVIPSCGNWYQETLKRMKIKVKSTIESSTFFITFDCVNEKNEPLIVKAYQYTKPLRLFPIVEYSEKYFQALDQNDFSICGFNPIKIIDKCAYLVRPKFEYTLSQRISDYPLPEEIEKKWISYELLCAINTFHELGAIHGNLHPDNVFLSWDLRLTIGDPAPYKPAQIHFNQPQTFIHFFGSSNTHCYLSPRRLIIKGDEEIINSFEDLNKSDDIFSVGCIIYFIFTQKHLFTLSTIRDYVEGRYGSEIEERLNELPESIRTLVKKCINLDSGERLLAFENINQYFPLYFSQFLSQIQEFFGNQITLGNLVKMIPVLEEFANIGGDDVRLMWTNILAQFLLKSDDLHSKVNFSYFFVNFFAPLSDEIVLTRVLPNIVGLLSSDSTLLTTTVFNCLEILFDNVQNVPPYLRLIFKNYLVPTLSNLITHSEINIQCAVWSFVPRFLKITNRLDPECGPSFVKIFSLILQSTEKVVIDSFSNSFELLIAERSLSFSDVYAQLLPCVYSPNIQLCIAILKIFQKFWFYIKPEEKREYRKIINGLLHVAISLSQGEHATFILGFLKWMVCEKIVERIYFTDIFNFVFAYFNSSESNRYIIDQIVRNLPDEFSTAVLPSFILSSLNRREPNSPKTAKVQKMVRTSFDGQINLMNNTKITINTKFITSKRVSLAPITSIIPMLHDEDLTAAVSDKDGYLYNLSKQANECSIIYKNENQINCSMTFGSQKESLLAEPLRILSVDWNPLKVTPLSYEVKSPILTIDKIFDDNCFYTTNSDSSSTFYDTRMKAPINKVSFSGLSMASTCVWPNSQTVGFGFDEGIVSLMDTRIFMPFHNYATLQAQTISPVFDEDGAFFVGGIRGSQVYNFTSNRPTVKLPFMAQKSISYKGSSIFFSQNATFLVKMQPAVQVFVLADMASEALKVKGGDEMQIVDDDEDADENRRINVMDGSICSEFFAVDKEIEFSEVYKPMPPLHNHSVPLTTVAEIEKFFASGDMVGNINLWKIE